MFVFVQESHRVLTSVCLSPLFTDVSSRCTYSVHAGANPGICVKSGGSKRTACHLSAAQLDSSSLSMLLAAPFPFRPNANTLDELGRTPLHVALVDGNGVGGSGAGTQRDAAALDQCTATLQAWGGQILHPKIWNIPDLDHPVYTLASQWKTPEMEVLLRHEDLRQSLHTRSITIKMEVINGPRRISLQGMSVAAFCQYPLHAALVSLRRKITELRQVTQEYARTKKDNVAANEHQSSSMNAVRLSPNNITGVASTVRLLLEHGFEPNERVDWITWGSTESLKELHSIVGFVPLHVLALTALELQIATKELMTLGKEVCTPERVSYCQTLEQYIAACAGILVSCGARLNVGGIRQDPRAKVLQMESERLQSKKRSSDRAFSDSIMNALKLEEGNTTLWALLGGKERLTAAFASFVQQSKAIMEPSSQLFRLQEQDGMAAGVVEKAKSSAILLPGGDSDVSCAICWSVFGTFQNRKHCCRSSHRHVCDDCSTKRIQRRPLNVSSPRTGEELRVSDGQYLLARHRSSKRISGAPAQAQSVPASSLSYKAARATASSQQQPNPSHLSQPARQVDRGSRSQAQKQQHQEEGQREELFGNIGKSVMNFLSGEKGDDDDITQVESASIGGLQSTLGETRDRLNERGEKLISLSEKSSALADASKEFADMAKELERQQRGGFFSW
jgi:hypothetical protein